MATETLVNEVRQISKDCIDTPIDELIRNTDWGKVNFEDIKDNLDGAFSIFEDLGRLPIKYLPVQILEPIKEKAASLQQTIKEIKSFDIIAGGDTGQRRNDIADTLKEKVDEFYTVTQSWIPYLAYKKGDVQRNMDELNDAVAEAKRICDEAEDKVKAKQHELDEIVIVAREASAKVGVGHFTTDFSKEAETLKKSAGKWLIATIAFGIVTVVASGAFLSYVPVPSGGYATVHMITTKLIILGLSFYATWWCGRIYKALMHQVTVNRHRANSIKTFQAFTKAASDDAARDAVLMETTKAIFGQGSTGYLDKDASGTRDHLQVVGVGQVPKMFQGDTTK